MKYRARKEEAERKLLNTQKNLVRLDDILAELGERIEPLREQSEKAIKYLKLRDELKDADVNLFIYQYERSSERIKQVGGAAEQLRAEISDRDAASSALSSELAAKEDEERNLSSAISETSQKLLAATARVEAHSGEERVMTERISALMKEQARLASESDAALKGIEEHNAAASELDALIEKLNGEVGRAASELESAEAELSALDEKVSEKEDELEAHKQSLMDRMNSLADTKSALSRLDEMQKAVAARKAAIGEEKLAVAEEGERLEKENAECSEAERQLSVSEEKLENERRAAIFSANGINGEIFSARDRERTLSAELESVRSRRRVLSEMKRAHEGYYSSVRDLLKDAERDASLSSLIEGVVAELISVPAEYETAVEMALGSALQNVVVPTEQDAKQVIEYLRRKKYGRATLLPVSAMRPRLLTNEERSFINVEGCFGVASELISFSPRYRGVAENLLGRTVIVRDLDVGIAINKRTRSSFRIATLSGDIMNPGGSMTGGSLQKREFSILGRERELEELKKRMDGISASVSKNSDEIAALTDRLISANSVIEEIQGRIKGLEISRASLRERHDIVLQYVEKNRQRMEKLDTELSAADDNLRDISEQRRLAEETESGLSSGSASTAEDIKRAQAELNLLRADRQSLAERVTSLKVGCMAVTKEHASAENDRARIRRELDALVRSTGDSAELAKKLEEETSLLREKLSEMSEGVTGERTEVDALTDEMRRLEEERARQLVLVDELRLRRDGDQSERDELRERLHRQELSLSRIQMELDALTARIWQDYELTYENALPLRHDIAVADTRQRAEALRTEIRSLGEVNTASVEDYRNVTERHAELSKQCEDLRKAEADLNEIIKRLTVTMEKEFSERFREIRKNFSETFTELFRGGRAELKLADEKDVLNCDIDIIAQPPGKKLQLLSLLSGGEQALTAIALLFAILKLKPTAFCILDEIDTSLDESNVENYADYLRDYSKDTQFIVITHRKGAMAVCDSLYGVSMEEKGVSALISARFDDNRETA